jgi:peroxiredoxin
MHQESANPTSPSPVRRRGPVLLLVAAGVILVVTVLRYRQLEEWKTSPPPPRAAARQLAPRFELADHRRHLVKFERFLGRQRVVLVFFDSELGADRDPRLLPLIEHFDRINSAGIEVVAVSTATRFENEQAEERIGRIPFPLLTDIDLHSPVPRAHLLWGRLDERSQQPLPGMFLVARDGTIPVGPDGKPLPVQDEQAVIETLIRGEWP